MYEIIDEMQHGGTSKFGFHIEPRPVYYNMQPSLSYYLIDLSGDNRMGGTLYG
jgi:hypothetical protein